MSWAERVADRSPVVQRSKSRSIEQGRVIVDAARRLWDQDGEMFTTQELVREAGVALQTFYRHFEGKDQLLLAVIEDTISESCVHYAEAAAELPDAVARLRFYITTALQGLSDPRSDGGRLMTAEHWRLHELFPEEMAAATRPYQELIRVELEDGRDAGLLAPTDVESDSWMIGKLVMSAFHHYAFASHDEPIETIAERLWIFCLRAVGGTPAAHGG